MQPKYPKPNLRYVGEPFPPPKHEWSEDTLPVRATEKMDFHDTCTFCPSRWGCVDYGCRYADPSPVRSQNRSAAILTGALVGYVILVITVAQLLTTPTATPCSIQEFRAGQCGGQR
jgi:hypothetical protein